MRSGLREGGRDKGHDGRFHDGRAGLGARSQASFQGSGVALLGYLCISLAVCFPNLIECSVVAGPRVTSDPWQVAISLSGPQSLHLCKEWLVRLLPKLPSCSGPWSVNISELQLSHFCLGCYEDCVTIHG